MGVYKDAERGTWFVELRYKNAYGEPKKKKKRGFKKQSDAKKWEAKFLNSLYSDPEITFENLYNEYIKDNEKRCKKTTLYNKKSYFKSHILPYFGKMKIKDISALAIRKWQNELLKNNYSQTYLFTLHKQLSAFFNFALKFYNLKQNPCSLSGSMGGKKSENEMKIWNLENFTLFLTKVQKEEPKLAFKLLFWTGMRIGELLALTFADIDFENNIIKINKTLSKVNNTILITDPKTKASIRNIQCPIFLIEEIKRYKNNFYDLKKEQRIINMTRHGLSRYIKTYSKRLGLEKIRLHDFRHSHASFLLHKNVNILVISKRLGHESPSTTLNIYAHLLPESNDHLKFILNEKKVLSPNCPQIEK